MNRLLLPAVVGAFLALMLSSKRGRKLPKLLKGAAYGAGAAVLAPKLGLQLPTGKLGGLPGGGYVGR